MASIEARIGELVAENRNLRQWLTDEAQARKIDHDKITQIDRDLKTAYSRIEELEKFKKEVEANGRKRLEEEIREKKEEGKEGRSRKFQIVVEIIGALAAALIGGVAAKWLFK